MREMLSIYRDRLINLSSKNRTLLLKKLYRKVAFDLKLLEKVNGEEFSIKLLNLLKKRYDGKIKVLSSSDSEESYKLYEGLRYLYREINSIQREKGSYDLYIGYPFVQGKFKDGTLINAPLLLFPVRLKIENEEVFLEDIEDDYININKTFILGFKKFNEIKLAEFELQFENLKCENIVEWLLEYLARNGIFIDKENEYGDVEFFKELDKFSADTYESGDLVVKNNLVIGQFPNSTSPIYDDYIELINKDKRNSLINNLVEVDISNICEKKYNSSKKPHYLEDDDGLENYFVTELDYSQETAIVASNRTQELVIYGPPGTGKSQVIVNLIVDNLAKGKKVLMVSQKKAAIDVVYNRLLKIGLDNRIANIESPNSDRQKVFSKIISTFNNIEDYFEHRYDSEFEQATEFIKLEKEKLEALSIVLNEKTDFGLSLNQLYSKSVNEYEYFIEELSDDFSIFRDIDLDSLEEILKNIDRISKYLKYDIDHVIIKNRKNFKNFQEIEKERILDIVLRIKRYTQEYRTVRLKNSGTENIEKIIIENKISSSELLDKLNNILSLIINGKTILQTIKNRNLNKLQCLSAIVKENKKWKIDYWKSRYELRKRVKGCSLKDTMEYIDEMIYINSLLGDIKKYFYEDLDFNIDDKESLIKCLNSQIGLIELVDKPISEIKLLEKYFNNQFLDILIQNVIKNGNWETILSDIAYVVNTSFDGLKTLDHLKSKLTEKEMAILEYGKSKYSGHTEDFIKAIRNTFYLKHIEIAENQNRDTVNSVDKPENINKRVEELLEQKRELVPKVVVNRLNNDLSDQREYSDMRYEAEKKRSKMSLRRFVHSFYDNGLLDVLPCWLVTPEVVSSVFPLEEGIFDLVIFDEASQMFIENSIPAIYRSRSVVIAGDDKQLQPNDLYMVKIEDSIGSDEREEFEYESKMSIEAKSLLELAKYKYHSITLNYHYRSRYEELINFSNYAFYNGKIEVVPNINDYKESSPIDRIKVDGRWIDRKNLIEAEKIVALLKGIFKTRENNETIGIITFNITQKECIEELIEREASRDVEFGVLYRNELERKEGDEYIGIFVKNIENVQGDERDIVIFSVGYAKNEEGRVVRNFGSLTMRHGENRLNVAISRAKTKIYLVTSIEPEELGYVENLSRGAILLKKYLQYVKAVSDKDADETRRILYSLDTIEKTDIEIIHFDSPFEEEVYDRLINAGLKVHTQVGSASYRIDMAIYDDEKSEYILGIECDGATYHSSVSARERDSYRQRFLESRGWTIHRIWSRDWWKNRDREIEKIILRIRELK